MARHLHILAPLARLVASQHPARRPARRAVLRLEALEDRRLLSTYPITEMTELARQFPRHRDVPATVRDLAANLRPSMPCFRLSWWLEGA